MPYQIPLEQMILPLVVLDDTPYLTSEPNHAFSAEDLSLGARTWPRAPEVVRRAAH